MATLGHLLDGNTLALWRLDEAVPSSGEIDATGSYPGGAPTGAGAGSVQSVTGLIADGGRARKLPSGSGAFMNAPANAAAGTALRGEWTIEVWGTLDPSWSARGDLFGASQTNLLADFHVDPNLLLVVTYSIGVATYVSTAYGPLSTGTRYHLAGRKRLNAGTYTLDIFVNGVRVATSGGYANTDDAGGSGTTLSIGCNNANTVWWNGTFDDMRISKVARTDAEIADSYWRGLIDRQSPQFAVPPLQVTGNQDFQIYQQALSPTALTDPTGTLFEAAFGSMKDVFADRLRLSLKSRLPQNAPPDALTQIGTERGMPQGQTESGTAYATRLQDAWNAWPWAGTPFGLLRAFYATGYTNVVLAQVRGGKQFTLDNGATNFLPWSQDFAIGGQGWSNLNSTLTPNSSAAPDGTTTASLFNEGTANGQHTLRSVATVPAEVLGDIRLYAVWVKAGTLPNIQIRRPYSNNTGINFNLSTGVIDSLRGLTSSILASGVQTGPNGWYRPWFAVQVPQSDIAGDTSDVIVLGCVDGTYNDSYTGTSRTFSIWGAQIEKGVIAPDPYTRTFANAKTIALAAGSLLTSTMANGIWETDPLTSYSPVNQGFWSKFDVVFPLPLMPPSWGWSGGIPSSSSNESNFIRALIKAWAPAHASCDRIIIVQQGNVWGYPATQLWGASTGLWGGSANTLWTP